MPFFTVIETERSLADKILDYSISQTTLEEVFLNVWPTLLLLKLFLWSHACLKRSCYIIAILGSIESRNLIRMVAVG